MTDIKWWQVWRYSELKRQNEENLAALVRERPHFTAEDARYLIALCKSGRKTPPWLVDRMVGEASNQDSVQLAARQIRDAIESTLNLHANLDIAEGNLALDEALYALDGLEEQLEAERERCPICTHEWRRHDPEDGKCDAGSQDFGECRCGRDLSYHRVRNASLSHARLLESNPAKRPT